MATFAVINNGAESRASFGVFTNPINQGNSIIPVPITVTGLNLTAPLTSGNSVTISMQKNGSNIPPPLTITYPTTHASITGLSDAYSAGENVTQSITVSPNPGTGSYWATTYQPSSPYQNLCLLSAFISIGDIGASPSYPAYISIDGVPFIGSDSNAHVPWPVSGTLRAWSVQYLTFSGQTTTFTLALRKNGVSVWTLTLPPNYPNATTVTDTVTAVPVAAGDLINYMLTVPSGSASLFIKSLILGFSI